MTWLTSTWRLNHSGRTHKHANPARRGMLSVLAGGAAALIMSAGASKSRKAGAGIRLIMFESDSCEFCQVWHDEVGIIYGKTPEGRFAPLQTVDLWEKKRNGGFDQIGGIVYTPTFVLLNGDKEVGRILGYPGEDLFWAMLDEILRKQGFRQES